MFFKSWGVIITEQIEQHTDCQPFEKRDHVKSFMHLKFNFDY